LETLQALQQGVLVLFSTPMVIATLVLGVFGGMIFGAIPGLTAALGVTLILPFTYSMPAAQGLIVLIGIYVGGISGGLISSVLLNIPGSPASLVTCFDGSPMAKQGHPGEALTLALASSFIGGVLSAIALVVIAPLLAKVALFFGPWEYMAMGIMGLGFVVGLTSKDVLKGLISSVIGILIAMCGIDPISAVERFTFGFWQLGAGLNILPVLMGLFAFAEILTQLRTIDADITIMPVEKISFFPSPGMFKGTGKTIASSTIIGTFIGIIPGLGQATASLISYNQARQMSKTPEKFGTGHKEGVIASEVANNACCGGALVPMMTMGIPGDLVTAILLGGLVVHGLQPGPLLFKNNADIVGTIYVTYIAATLIMYVLGMSLMRIFIKVLKVPLNYLYPLILLCCIVGSITVNSRIFDIWVMLIIGLLG